MATFSEIAITFTDDFEWNTNSNSTVIGYSDFSTQVGNVLGLTIVQTRANSFEFSAGTDATTQAQNYKDAFDLDYVPSGDWECEISGATVTVKSTDPNIEFNTFFAGAPNDTRFTFVITNTSTNIPTTDGLMFARSNYYLTIPVVDEIRQDVRMYFRTGDITLPFDTPDYEKRVIVPSDDTSNLDIIISRFALDFLEPRPVYSAALEDAVISLSGSVIATTVTTKNDTQLGYQERIKNLITTRGYSNYSQGANFLDTTSEILLSSTIHRIQKDSQLMFPVLVDGQTITIEDDQGAAVYTDTLGSTNEIETKIQYIFLDTSQFDSKYFVVQDNYIFKVIDECKYTPQEVYFLNKFGVFENLTFFKAKTENTNFDKMGEYENNFVSGGSYDTSRHMYRQTSMNGRTSITLNTGYLDQEQNAAIEQLLNSDYVFFNDAGTFTPVNVDTNSLQVLTSLNDKLINYAIDFKYSYDLVQNV